MKTNTAISDSIKTIPPAAIVLLVLAALLTIFAWKLMQISPTLDHSTTNVRTTTQAHRHQGVSVDPPLSLASANFPALRH